MTEPAAISYRAFLSYAHADTAWAKWLHAALEGSRIDKDLVGRATALGPVPQTLRPIFRDREDFSGGHALTDATVLEKMWGVQQITVDARVKGTRAQSMLKEGRTGASPSRISKLFRIVRSDGSRTSRAFHPRRPE